jgi:hypothetical protein
MQGCLHIHQNSDRMASEHSRPRTAIADIEAGGAFARAKTGFGKSYIFPHISPCTAPNTSLRAAAEAQGSTALGHARSRLPRPEPKLRSTQGGQSRSGRRGRLQQVSGRTPTGRLLPNVNKLACATPSTLERLSMSNAEINYDWL